MKVSKTEIRFKTGFQQPKPVCQKNRYQHPYIRDL